MTTSVFIRSRYLNQENLLVEVVGPHGVSKSVTIADGEEVELTVWLGQSVRVSEALKNNYPKEVGLSDLLWPPFPKH